MAGDGDGDELGRGEGTGGMGEDDASGVRMCAGEALGI